MGDISGTGMKIFRPLVFQLVILLLICLCLQEVNCLGKKEQNFASSAYVFRNLLHLIEPRSTSSDKFVPGPNGKLCKLSDRRLYDRRYEWRDDHGWCCCALCNAGTYVKNFCSCGEPNGQPAELTECVLVDRGTQYMDKANKCTEPYNCSTSCNSHQTKVANCTARSDITCECKEGWYNPYPSEGRTIPRKCRARPHCPAGQGQEQQSIDGSEEIVFTCQPCQPGYYQHDDNSTASCQPRRECTVKAGSSTADNVCLNDDLLNWSKKAERAEEPPSESKIPGPTREMPSVEPQEENDSPSTPSHTKHPGEIPSGNEEGNTGTSWCPAAYVTVIACIIAGVLFVTLVGFCVYVRKHQGSYSTVRPSGDIGLN